MNSTIILRVKQGAKKLREDCEQDKTLKKTPGILQARRDAQKDSVEISSETRGSKRLHEDLERDEILRKTTRRSRGASRETRRSERRSQPFRGI